MKTAKLMLGVIPVSLAILLSGCSASGQTPFLPSDSSTSASASSTPETSGNGSAPTKSTSNASTSPSGETGTNTGKQTNTGSASATPSNKTSTSPSSSPSFKPMDLNAPPVVLPEPVYDEEPKEASKVENPAAANDAFNVYLSYFNALKAQDWNKACSLVDVDPTKGQDFCIAWFAQNKWDTSITPKFEDYIISQEKISHEILMQKIKSPKMSRDLIRMKPVKGTWKVSVPVMETSE